MGVIVFVTTFYQVSLGDCRGPDESLIEDYLTDVFLIFLKCFQHNNIDLCCLSQIKANIRLWDGNWRGIVIIQ